MSDGREQDGTAIPQYETNSIDDLAELLDRAGNWAERDVHAEVIAAELHDARDFVEAELAEPEVPADD